MKIAIQAADLDYDRIDGTRVYLLNLLKYFGKLDATSEFLVYHKDKFNPELTPPNLPNYRIKKISAPIFWTQTKFAWEIWKDKPNVLWMPVHNIPFIRKKNLKTVITIHDLAFKYFPEHFPKKALWELNVLTDWAVNKSDKIIAVSQSTKNDIIKFYPKINPSKIKVIHHGFDTELFQEEIYPEVREKILETYELKTKNYILYVGAIQPRKNLKTLIEAFEIYKKQSNSSIKLVLAGGKGWLWKSIIEMLKNSPYNNDIITTGELKFGDLRALYRDAGVFVFPSLYEGFGIPILEAFASKIPVICAKNSSLEEVGGNSALYFEASDTKCLAEHIKNIMSSTAVQNNLINKGLEQIKKFSWEKCAQETLEYLKS